MRHRVERKHEEARACAPNRSDEDDQQDNSNLREGKPTEQFRTEPPAVRAFEIGEAVHVDKDSHPNPFDITE